MKVGDLVILREEYKVAWVAYGIGIITEITDYPEEGFTSHRVIWSDGDFSYHSKSDLELVSESR
tara:strand:- start:688 stop:879 length:192 start_codon:yes stop_codon:yes gene_type:complete